MMPCGFEESLLDFESGIGSAFNNADVDWGVSDFDSDALGALVVRDTNKDAAAAAAAAAATGGAVASSGATAAAGIVGDGSAPNQCSGWILLLLLLLFIFCFLVI